MTPTEEGRRLEALRRTGLLDSPPEPEFDEVVQVAAAICGTPISLISLVDEKRQWFKASVGLDVRETSREVSFCDHAIRQPSPLVVEDTTRDPRFCDNPFVAVKDGVRFYAGVPVRSPDGQPLGSLCVVDRRPRELTREQQAALKVLADQVSARIELRMQRLMLQRALADAEEARAKLAVADRRFQAFLNNGPFIAYLKDAEGRYLTYNAAFAKLFHISLTDWIGSSDHQVFPPDFADAFRANDLKVIRTQAMQVDIEETINPDGSTTCWRSYKFPCAAEDGSTWVGGISLNVSAEIAREKELERSKAELQEANRRLTELATTDALTGLPNRRVFCERLQLEFNRSRRKKLALSVLMIDVDNFKHRNDTYGHDEGDAVLRQLGQLLGDIVRETDLAARYGGEEFVVLLPEAAESDAVGMAQRILDAVRAADWGREPVTISLGAAALDAATPNEQRLITLADEALYVAKRGGKDRVVGYRSYYEKMLAELQATVTAS